MHKRFLLLTLPLLVVVVATGVAVAAPSAEEHSRGFQLDKLHAERPIAASVKGIHLDLLRQRFIASRLVKIHRVRPSAASRDHTADAFPLDYDYLADANKVDRAAQLAQQAEQEQQAAQLAAQQAAAEAAQAQQAQQAQPAPQVQISTASSAVSSDSNPGDFLSCVRQRESGGNYGVYNAGGSGAAGAYQFMPGTWNSIASSTGRGDLVGIDPAQASPADQDAMAQALYAQQGSAPWGGGC
jgi:hypothetical protein